VMFVTFIGVPFGASESSRQWATKTSIITVNVIIQSHGGL